MKPIVWMSIIFVILVGMVWGQRVFFAQPDRTLSASLAGNLTTPAGFKRADGSHAWDFPADFGPHPEYQTEWWYYTGNLQTKDGHRFGYQLTFFRRGLTPALDVVERGSRWGTNQVYMAHFALSDIETKQHYTFERFSRGAAELAGAQAEPFQVWLENWVVLETIDHESGSGNSAWRMKAEQDRVSLDLFLIDEKGLIFQGVDGYSQKGPEVGNASYYFSQTRLNSSGVVKIDDQEFDVTGLSWMDHEFSTSALSADQVGWDWFSLQLDDGTDLMAFQIRQADGSIDPFSSGTVVDADGTTTHLSREQFDIVVKETWRSPQSGARYPAAWIIHIPQIDLSLEIEPYLADQEMNASYVYWEGAVGVQGTHKGQMVSGSGYIEMTGYTNSMEGEF